MKNIGCQNMKNIGCQLTLERIEFFPRQYKMAEHTCNAKQHTPQENGGQNTHATTQGNGSENTHATPNSTP